MRVHRITPLGDELWRVSYLRWYRRGNPWRKVFRDGTGVYWLDTGRIVPDPLRRIVLWMHRNGKGTYEFNH